MTHGRASLLVPALLVLVSVAVSAAPAGPSLSAIERAREARRSEVRRLAADVVIDLSSPAWQGAGSCQGRLVARRPGELRLQGYAAVMTVFDAGTDARNFWLYLPPASRAIVGTAGEESLLVGLPILPGEVVAALFGEPYGAPADTASLRPATLDGKPAVAWTLRDGYQVVARYRKDPVVLERAELRTGDRTTARLDYVDYRKRRGVWWPTRIEFRWPEADAHLHLSFDRVSFGDSIDASAFAFAPPAGVTVTQAADWAP